MARVKMNAKHEYEFIANYKVMQNVFKAKKIDKARSHFFLILHFHNSNAIHLHAAYTGREAREMQDAVRATAEFDQSLFLTCLSRLETT
jgi:hypothetical protein